MDVNQDGVLQWGEFMASVYPEIDLNKDGIVDPQEWSAYLASKKAEKAAKA